MNNPTKLEKLAAAMDPTGWRFIVDHEHDDPPHPAVPITRATLLRRVRAVLSELRTPDAAMRRAGAAHNPGPTDYVGAGWLAIIDSILTETPGAASFSDCQPS